MALLAMDTNLTNISKVVFKLLLDFEICEQAF